MEHKVWEWWRQFKFNFNETKLIYGLSVVVFLSGLLLLSWFVWQYFSSIPRSVTKVVVEEIEEIKDCDFRRLLDGVCVSVAEKTNPNLVAVMIENHPDSRPQSGLSKASIVYEAPVEANYTRFMAIYPVDATVEQIGPVRSARPYYLDWVSEYGQPMYMHCGGSPDALDKIKIYQIFDVNEFYYGNNFWRSPSRLAPHNVYTSSELWSKIDHGSFDSAQDKFLSTDFTDWWGFVTGDTDMRINADVVDNTVVVDSIRLPFLLPSYDVEWKYNSSTQKYERWQAGAEHRELDGTLIIADTVIVQHVKTQVLDEIGRIAMETVGSGTAEVYYDGIKQNGQWQKTDRNSRTKFYNPLGEEIKLKPGKIWIEVINTH